MGDSWVGLDDAKRSEYAKAMAVIWTRVEDLKAKKARDAKRTQEEIDEELEEIARICRVINDNGETKDQLSLFVPEEQAKQALAALSCRQPGCSPIKARRCEVHGTCTCEPAVRKCSTCDYSIEEVQGAVAYLCPNCPDTTLLQVMPEGDAPAVASPDCTLHGVNAPHATEPQAQADGPEPTEPQIVEKMAQEAVEEWARLGKTPESVKDRNALVKAAIAATSMPIHRRKPFGQAVARLLSDSPSIPAGAGASTEPVEEADGNVAEPAEEAQA